MATWFAQKGTCNVDSVSGGTTSDVWNSAANGSGSWMDTSVLTAGGSTNLVTNTFSAIALNIALNLGTGTITNGTSLGGTAGGAFTIAAGSTQEHTFTVLAYGVSVITLTGTGTTTLTFNGDSTGGGNNARGIQTTPSNTSVTLNGTSTGGTGPGGSCAGIDNPGGGSVTTVTNAVGGAGAPGVFAGPTVTGNYVVVTGNMISGATGVMPVYGRIHWNPATAANYYKQSYDGTNYYYHQKTYDGDDIIEGSTQTGAAPETPNYHEATVAEVQDGVFFGPSSTLEGTYAGGGSVIVLED